MCIRDRGCTAAVKQTDRQTGAAEKTDEKLSVVTTIFPQYDFVREIAGEEVELKMLLKPGEETQDVYKRQMPLRKRENCLKMPG